MLELRVKSRSEIEATLSLIDRGVYKARGGGFFNGEMFKYCGKRIRVTKYHGDKYDYVQGRGWNWRKEWLCPLRKKLVGIT